MKVLSHRHWARCEHHGTGYERSRRPGFAFIHKTRRSEKKSKRRGQKQLYKTGAKEMTNTSKENV